VSPAVPPSEVEGVVVPLDGSAFSWSALPVAARLAGELDAGVHLVSVVASEDEVDERDAELAIAALELPFRPASRSVLVAADPADGITLAMDRTTRSLCCMASHGRGRSAALVGSVATEVVARSGTAVVLMSPLVDQPPPGQGVMACVDGTEASAALVTVAVDWAEVLRQPVTVVTVAEDAPEPVSGGPINRRFGPDGDVDAALAVLADPLRDRGCDVQTLALYDPISPWSGLERYLSDNPAHLVVTSSRARTGVTRAVFGSVAAAIVRHSPSPVLMTCRDSHR
jgi:nucleotide-binding universal stress UspA family protein